MKSLSKSLNFKLSDFAYNSSDMYCILHVYLSAKTYANLLRKLHCDLLVLHSRCNEEIRRNLDTIKIVIN